jgi:threonine aldolase
MAERLLTMTFDLRSDTVTQPTAAMRQAMAQAPVGDDVYREDPTVAALEARAAEITGKAAALFVPSGTMANQIAILCQTRPGDEVICGRGAHCAYYESGAGGAWAGVQFEQVGTDGLFDADEVETALKPRAYYCPHSALVTVENTHNRAGGRIFPQPSIDRIASLARRHELRLHLDGARIWNAAIATGKPVASLAQPFDTVSVCFSKGLGAPVGSAICGDAATIDRALRFRKMLGGGMRQAGILAAGALHALDHHLDRIADDHEAAQRLGQALGAIDGVAVATIDTNIVNVDVPGAAERFADAGRRHAVLFSPVGPRRLRLVTHLGVSGEGFDRCLEAVTAAFVEALGAA